jgi:hypothetical protein
MILLWGPLNDGPLAAVHRELRRHGVRLAVIDQRDALTTRIEMTVSYTVQGLVQMGERIVHLEDVKAAYLRPHDPRPAPEEKKAAAGSLDWIHSLSLTDALSSWADLTTAHIINRPIAMASNGSKPYDSARIARFGFRIPHTLISTDPDAVLAFWERHGSIVYKSVSGVRSIVRRLAPEDESRLADVAWCPTQFQQHVAGADYRVHVVGDDVFACEIISDADDYRYAWRQGYTVEIRPRTLPVDCADRCKAMVATMGLIVAGVDLRWAADGSWYCFEVNPSPGFTFFEAATGQPIAEAIARWLVKHTK